MLKDMDKMGYLTDIYILLCGMGGEVVFPAQRADTQEKAA